MSRRIALTILLICFASACGDAAESSGGVGGSGGGTGGTGGTGGGSAVPCNEVFIVDLNQDELARSECASQPTRESIASCLADEIENALPTECTTAFDVFVPGTAAEHGAWKQFNAMFSRDTGRGYLSLQYQDAIVVEGLGNTFDAASYDQGVIDATTTLSWLLYTLQTRFTDDIRVFGHSKGSHAVALVADDAEFRDIEFYAFAQPGRTSTDISSRDDIVAGKRGRAGYIEKVTDNLVGITWRNDEVQFYTGNGFNGLQMPERWSYPGYIFQDTFNGANPLSFRIDHHNNYGGTYTDGRAANDWRVGEGSKEDQYPYCATGNSFFGSKLECEKKAVDYVPYFWGDADCREMAFDLMATGSVGASHYIGNSGPRASGCTEDVTTLSAAYELRYRINIGDLNDGDCRYDLEIFLGGLGDRPDGGRIEVSTSQVADTGWRTTRGTVRVPPHMTIRVTATMTDTASGFRDCGGLSVAASEAYIETLKLEFTHPGTGKRIERTVIGLKEGSTAVPWPLARLDRQNNVAWWEDDPDNDEWHLYYAPAPFESLMVKGDTDGGVRGRFYKWVDLLD